MNIDTAFLRTFVKFLEEAFPDDLDAKQTVGRADIIVYGLATKLCSLTGAKVDFLNWASRSGGGVPHVEGGGGTYAVAERSGGGVPHVRRLDKLVSYAEDVATPELSDAYRSSPPAR
jgi:hypothetical protein